MRILQDLRYAFRRLRNSPAFAATAVLTLALGMGATTAMYSVIQAVLLNALPFPNASRLVIFRESEKGGEMSVAWPNFADMRAQQHSFEGLAAFQGHTVQYFDGEQTTLPVCLQTTHEFFPLLQAKPELGRTFTEAEDKPGAPAVVVLSHKFWQNQLHGEPNIVGKSLDLSGKPYTVLGVMPASFHFWLGRSEDLYVPLGPEASDPNFNNRTAHGSMSILALPKPGVTQTAARTEMESIAARLAAEYPATNGGHSVKMGRLVDNYFAQIRPALWLLMVAVGIVLLVACANVSNLLLTRGADREREYAIRSALGASGSRIFAQSVSESLWLAIGAAICGILIAQFSLPLLLKLGPTNIPRLRETGIHWPVLIFAFAVTLVVSLVCGAIPGWATLRVAPEQALRSHSTSSYAGRGRRRLRTSLLVVGVAVTVLLSAGTGLFLQSLRRTLAVDPGFQPDHLLALQVVLAGDKYTDPKPREAFFLAAKEKLRALPGVAAVGNVCAPALAGECGDWFYSIPGRMSPDDPSLPDANFNSADENYFSTMGIRLLSGRTFLSTDTVGSQPVVIVNEAFARKWWPQGDAVGHVVRFGGRGEPGQLVQIVGVIDNLKQWGLDAETDPEIYFPERQKNFGSMVLMLRTSGDPEFLAKSAQNAIASVDKEVPVVVHPMSYFLEQTLRQRQFLTLLFSIFAGLAIVLAAMGIFGVAAYAVASRRSEIAIRIALGAQPQRVKRWISLQVIARVAVGCALGVIGALASAKVVRSLLFGVSATDPLVLSSTCALLLVVAFLATWIPARRAAAVDPMQSLRAE